MPREAPRPAAGAREPGPQQAHWPRQPPVQEVMSVLVPLREEAQVAVAVLQVEFHEVEVLLLRLVEVPRVVHPASLEDLSF